MSVGRRALKSTLFVSLGSYASVIVGLITSIVLARFLLPEHFGLVALANFFFALFGRVREFGLEYALIHRQDKLKEAFSTHFIMQIGLSLISLLLVLVSLPLLRLFYKPEVITILLIFSLFAILQSASHTYRVALEKDLQFGYTSLITFLALFLSSTVSISLAAFGFGFWSLVVGNVINTVINFAGLFASQSWKFELKFDRELFFWFLKFGFFMWLGAIATFVVYQYNDWVIGTFLGAATLGFYTKALQFAQLPTSLVTSLVSKVALPTYSKLQGDAEKLSAAFNLVLSNILRFAVPISLIIFLLSPEIITILIGERWLPMVPILRLLIIYSLMRPIFDDTGALITAIGKPKIVSNYLLVQALLLLILSPLLTFVFHVEGAAIALDIIMLVGVGLAYLFVAKNLKLTIKRILLSTTFALTLTVFVFFLTNNWLGQLSISNISRLLIKFLLITITYFPVVILLDGKQFKKDLVFVKEVIKNKGG